MKINTHLLPLSRQTRSVGRSPIVSREMTCQVHHPLLSGTNHLAIGLLSEHPELHACAAHCHLYQYRCYSYHSDPARVAAILNGQERQWQMPKVEKRGRAAPWPS